MKGNTFTDKEKRQSNQILSIMKDIKQIQIEQLQRDIRILEDIISGKMENYTSHPIPVLKEGLSKFQSDLARLQENVGQRGY